MSQQYPDLINTSFPNSVDQIVSLLAITTTDGPLVKSFQEYIQKGDFASAQNVFNQIQNGNQKLLSPEYFNKLRDAILALERFYKTDVETYVDTKQTEWENIVDRLSFLSSYNPTTQYVKNNYVSYTLNGQTLIYICIANPPIGTIPTNTTYWRVLTAQGQRGPTGTGASFLYEWSASTTYNPQDMVEWENKWYIAVVENMNQTPYVGSSYWSVVLQLNSTVYPVQETEPPAQEVGQLWFQIVP